MCKCNQRLEFLNLNHLLFVHVTFIMSDYAPSLEEGIVFVIMISLLSLSLIGDIVAVTMMDLVITDMLITSSIYNQLTTQTLNGALLILTISTTPFSLCSYVQLPLTEALMSFVPETRLAL